MQPPVLRTVWVLVWMMVLTALVWPISGCASGEKRSAADAADAANAGSGDPAPAASAAASAREHAERISAAIAGAANAPFAGPPEVQWLDPGSPVPPRATTATANRTPAPPTPTPAVTAPEPAAPPTPAPSATPAPDPPLDRATLLARLLEVVRRGDEPALIRALNGATLSLLTPQREVDPALLEPLDERQRELVLRYGQVLSLMHHELARDTGDLARDSIDRRLDELFGQQPIRIRTLQLCRRVSGYGIYEPFETHTFLAGREQKMILYVELEHFRPFPTDDDRYEVKLQQEVMLFNEADGLAVWRHEPVQIVDTSRNRRRDFFVVQLINLPSRLTVGKYRLKVRVTDLHGGSLDETTTRLEIVADTSLVQGQR